MLHYPFYSPEKEAFIVSLLSGQPPSAEIFKDSASSFLHLSIYFNKAVEETKYAAPIQFMLCNRASRFSPLFLPPEIVCYILDLNHQRPPLDFFEYSVKFKNTLYDTTFKKRLIECRHNMLGEEIAKRTLPAGTDLHKILKCTNELNEVLNQCFDTIEEQHAKLEQILLEEKAQNSIPLSLVPSLLRRWTNPQSTSTWIKDTQTLASEFMFPPTNSEQKNKQTEIMRLLLLNVQKKDNLKNLYIWIFSRSAKEYPQLICSLYPLAILKTDGDLPKQFTEGVHKIRKIERCLHYLGPLKQKLDIKLLEAAKEGHRQPIEKLAARGFNFNTVKGKAGSTLLGWAAVKGHYELVKLLLRHGANVNQGNDVGDTPLILTIAQGHRLLKKHIKQIKLLMKNGALLWPQGEINNTALHEAMLVFGKPSIRLKLLKALLSIPCKKAFELQNDWGETPLELACKRGYVEAVKLLLDKGALPSPFCALQLAKIHPETALNILPRYILSLISDIYIKLLTKCRSFQQRPTNC